MDDSTRRTLAVIAEMIAGALLGAAAAYVIGMGVGQAMDGPQGEGFRDIVYALIAAAITYPIAVAAGVTLTGRQLFKRPGSFWMAILGAFGGALIILVLLAPFVATMPALLRFIFLALPPIVSALAFTRSASKREERMKA